MTDRVLFQMWGPYRQSLIAGHTFYVEQAEKRLLSQFGNIEAEADKAADEWLENSNHLFDPDRHDPGDFYEAANDAGIEFYQLLSDMRDRTVLSVVAGMFHEWDKQLREWLVREIQHWHAGDKVAEAIWRADFVQICDLLSGLGWNVSAAPDIVKLDACRLVVNAYKHGEGKSFDDLNVKYPEYVSDPFEGELEHEARAKLINYTHLRVTDEQMTDFSDAIVKFWQDVPENIFDSQVGDVPKWFIKALESNRENNRKANAP